MTRSSQFPAIRLGVVLLVVIASLALGSFVSPVTADRSSVLDQSTSTPTQPTNASVTIDENETTRREVVLTAVTLPNPGYIVAYRGNYTSAGPTNKSIIGRTQYVRAGTFQDVIVTFNESITNNTTVVVTVHNETNGNEAFDFVNQSGPDPAYENQSGSPVADTVRLGSVPNQSSKPNQSENPPQLPKQITLSGGYSTGNQSNTYSIAVSGRIEGRNLSSNDTVENGNRVEGTVKYQDSETLYYSGEIVAFNASEDITASLGGQEVSTEALGENRITLSQKNNNSSTASTHYQFSVSGMVVPSATATNDTWYDETTIMGQLGPNDTTDMYYYSGNITQSSITRSARVTINGEQVQVKPESNGAENNSRTRSSTGTAQPNPKAGFRLSNLTLSKQRIETGRELAVNVTITNIKSSRLQTTIGLATAGTVTSSKEITLFANGSQRVTFRHGYEAPGHYVVKIGILNDSSYVVAESETEKSIEVLQRGALTPTPTSTPNSNQQSSGFGPGFGVIAGVIAVVIVVGFVFMRQ